MRQTHSRRRPTQVLVAALVSVGLIAACSGDDDKNISGDGATTTAGGSETTAGGPDNTGEPTTLPPPTTVAGLEPVQGGSLVMGIEADTSSPWVPAEMVCAISCHQVIRSVYDPLALPNADNTVTPYLAESITSNDDFTVWTITARSDVKFHDGTPFDGAAIVDNLSRHKAGLLTGKVFKDVTTIEVDPADPASAVVTISTPWAAFPFALTGQIGYMASPTWLAASDADATQKSKPVGTGPFTYVDYVPNEFFKAERNDDYWNQPYPYLDAIEFRPIPDALNRRDALKSGTVDLIHTTNGQTIADFRETGEFPMVEITNKGETGYSLLHVTNPDEPALQDRRVRCALAHATDNQAIIDTIGAGVNPIANGPFSPTQVGYLEETGFPVVQDIPKAQELIAEYKAENPGSITISLATTQDETNLTIAQFQKQWFEEAGIDEVTLDQIDQGSYIVQALLGNFEVFQWRNHGGFDLDNQYVWWHSSTSLDLGQLALNFGRIKDPALDALLDENRAIQDPVRKKEIAEEVNRLFATECYNLWGSWTTWGIPHKENIQGISDFTLPNGDVTSLGAGISGTFYAHTLWVQP